MLMDTEQGYGKQLLKLLVSEIRVRKTDVTLTGSKGVLADAVSEMKLGTPAEEVPSIVTNWHARDDEDGHWHEAAELF